MSQVSRAPSVAARLVVEFEADHFNAAGGPEHALLLASASDQSHRVVGCTVGSDEHAFCLGPGGVIVDNKKRQGELKTMNVTRRDLQSVLASRDALASFFGAPTRVFHVHTVTRVART